MDGEREAARGRRTQIRRYVRAKRVSGWTAKAKGKKKTSVEPQPCDHKKEHQREDRNVNCEQGKAKQEAMAVKGEETEHKIITPVEYNERIGYFFCNDARW